MDNENKVVSEIFSLQVKHSSDKESKNSNQKNPEQSEFQPNPINKQEK